MQQKYQQKRLVIYLSTFIFVERTTTIYAVTKSVGCSDSLNFSRAILHAFFAWFVNK